MAGKFETFPAVLNDHQLREATQAFETAWAKVAPVYNVESSGAARERLAKIVLRIMPVWKGDADLLAEAALINFLRGEGKGEGMH